LLLRRFQFTFVKDNFLHPPKRKKKVNKVKSDPKSLKLSGARLFLVHNVNIIIQKAN
jgi:hypothetical protein